MTQLRLIRPTIDYRKCDKIIDALAVAIEGCVEGLSDDEALYILGDLPDIVSNLEFDIHFPNGAPNAPDA